MTSDIAKSDKAFNDLLVLEATETPLKSPLVLDEHSIQDIKASSQINKFGDIFLETLKSGDLQKVAKKLDIVLALGLEEDQSEYTALFFTSLESVVNQLIITKLEEFWLYLEARVTHLRQLAHSNHSIIFLRICKASLDRINGDLYPELVGRVLQVMAAVKGFAHQSRLNKRGKYWTSPTRTTGTVAIQQAIPAQLRMSPYEAKLKLRNLTSLSDPLQFLERLLKELKRRRKIGLRSFADILPTSSWDEISSLTNKLFYIQAWISLAEFGKTSTADWPDEIISEIKMCLRKSEVQFLEEHCFDPEKLWAQWKADQCPPIETAVTEPLNLETYKTDTSHPEITQLSGIIGNEKLTNLLEQQYSLERFAVVPKSENEIELIKSQIIQSENTAKNESHDLKTLRLIKWGDLAEIFNSQPEVDQSSIREMEDEAAENDEIPHHHENAGVPQAYMPTEPDSSTKRSSAPLENIAKRPRLSYEDTRYGERQRAMENTVKPLPY